MPQSTDNNDRFWDISDMVPKKKFISRAPASDTSAVTVDTGITRSDGGEKIPDSVISRTKAAPQAVEYDIENKLVRHVKLMPWPTGFSFYSKFHRDAQKYFDVNGHECNYEYFFSYMPQYEQLSPAQLDYYLYWRSLVRKDIYPPADSSYIFLYLYEIINLPDLISPEKGAEALVKLWSAYRGKYRYLDKYIGEWLCDYCLIYNIPLPKQSYEHISSAFSKLSLPEFYIDPASDDFSYSIISSLSSYDYKKSRFYTEHASEFDTHIPAAAMIAAKTILSGDLSKLNVTESHSLRDSFSGAIAYPKVKFKIEVTSYSLRRSREIHQMMTLAEKAAENELRSALGIKSRFATAGLDEDIMRAITAYFDTFYPVRRRKKKKQDDEDAPYMKYYAPRNVGTADVARALRIERDAWETAVLLEPEDVAHESPAGAPAGDEAAGSAGGAQGARASAFAEAARRPAPESSGGGDEMSEFFASLDQTLSFAVKAALDGEFAAFCRRHNIMELDAQRRINELSSEYIGDMLIDSDFTVIEDYKDEAVEAMTACGIISTEENR